MAISDTVAVLIGAVIGAGGAVLAQITASIFSGRHDTKRLEWEQAKEAREWDRRRAERFLDLKRELYSDFGAQASRWSSFISRAQDLPRPELPEVEKLHRVMSNIELIAPPAVNVRVRMAGVELIGAVFGTFASDMTPEQIKEEGSKASSSLARAKSAMRTDLRGDEETDQV